MCSRIENFENKIPDILKDFFKKNSKNLNISQREIFADFLFKFSDIFSEKKIVTGNCDLVEYVINLNVSRPIKQSLRRIPILMREEVNKIVE